MGGEAEAASSKREVFLLDRCVNALLGHTYLIRERAVNQQLSMLLFLLIVTKKSAYLLCELN